jgi:4-diphosphocytidyl-2-C-methyl-D-erythritol kinase
MLKSLSEYFELKLTNESLKSYAIKLGADCAFFIENRPAFATGIGEKLDEIEIDLKGYSLLLVKPPFGVGTKEAYAKIIPTIPNYDLKSTLKSDIHNWQGVVKNDFEPTVFEIYPQIADIKKTMLKIGAVYASMSGSGSSVFGIFRSKPEIDEQLFPKGSYIWSEVL